MEREQLTEKQRKVLAFIKDFIIGETYPPTVREILAHFRFKSVNTVAKYLKQLERKGYISRTPHSSRAIELIGFSGAAASRMFPVVGQIQAGSPHLAVENQEGHVALDASLTGNADEGSFFLKICGDSMIDAHIQDGDYALIHPQKTARNGDIVAVRIDDDATLKYFHRMDDHIELHPANDAFQPIILRGEEDVEIIGHLVTIVRPYRKR